MLSFRLVLFAILFYGTCAFSRNLVNLFFRCNPPEELVGKFCAATMDNDLNGDGRVDFSDLDKDYLNYNYDDDICVRKEWEVVTRLMCRYGFSEEYSRYMARSFAATPGGFASFNVDGSSGGRLTFESWDAYDNSISIEKTLNGIITDTKTYNNNPFLLYPFSDLSYTDFLMLQYTRFKNTYCTDPKNRVSPVDKLQCDEVDKLKPEDIKCA